MCWVSSLLNAPVNRVVPDARAASSKARLVIDFEPGSRRFPLIGPAEGKTRIEDCSKNFIEAVTLTILANLESSKTNRILT